MVGSIASGPQVVPDGRSMPSPPGSVSSPVSPAPRVRRGSECSCSSQPPTCHLPAERCNSTGGATVAQLPCRVVGQAAKGLDLTAASCRGSPSVADGRQRHLAAAFSDEPLDLSVRGCCSSSSCSPPPSAALCADVDGGCSPVLDLSLPDQESPVEVCYTCGLLVRRVTLHAVLALPRGRAPAPREPFFPSLLERRRPAGSRPMAPSGRVRVCGACRQTLLIQWDEYQRSGVVAPEQRVYALRRRRPSDSSCAKCGVLCPTSAAHALCTRCRQEVTGPPLAVPGLPEDSRCSRIIEEAVRGAAPRAPLAPPPQPSTSTMAERRSRQHRQLACRRCGRQTPRSGLVETRLAARNSSPFSRTGAALASGTTLVCQSCLRALSRQWRVRQQLPAARTTRSCSRAAAAADATDAPAASSAQLTAGCYACHQPLQSDAAYQVRTEPRTASSAPRLTPYFPHLARQNIALPPAVQTVAVCVFCYHALQDQWRRYERLSRPVAPAHRQYDTHFFACLVCGITTYRKRLHLLEVKDFPFLTKSHRLPERALLVCDGSRAVVCRDCHNTLHSQFQDYEKLRLPVDKREYNWVQRPPPPESPSPQATHDTMKLVRVADGGSVLRLSNA